jgi:transaldolase
MPASLTSVDEVMQLAGAHHVTVAPLQLAELAATPAASWTGRDTVGQVFTAAAALPPVSEEDVRRYEAIVKDESLWRLAFTRSDAGRNEGKILQAINIFCDMQEALEGMARKMDAAK